MKPSRLDVYEFKQADFIQDANGNSVIYSNTAINGEIVKIIYTVGTWAQTGSLNIEVSGTGEPILLMKNVLNTSQIKYPVVHPVDNTNAVTGSPQGFMRREVGPDGILKVWASGVGPIGSVCNGLSVFYRC